MNTREIHQRAMEKLGIGEYNRLILNERAFNQLHWADKFTKVMVSDTRPSEKLKRIQAAIDEMGLEAEGYKRVINGDKTKGDK